MSRLSSERVTIAQEIVGRFPRKKSALIPLLHLAQEQDGYVAQDAMVHIAEMLDLAPAEVYGTASFYEMFKFHPIGKYCINICTNQSNAILCKGPTFVETNSRIQGSLSA